MSKIRWHYHFTRTYSTPNSERLLFGNLGTLSMFNEIRTRIGFPDLHYTQWNYTLFMVSAVWLPPSDSFHRRREVKEEPALDPSTTTRIRTEFTPVQRSSGYLYPTSSTQNIGGSIVGPWGRVSMDYSNVFDGNSHASVDLDCPRLLSRSYGGRGRTMRQTCDITRLHYGTETWQSIETDVFPLLGPGWHLTLHFFEYE